MFTTSTNFGPLEAANGMLMFGVTTTMVFAVFLQLQSSVHQSSKRRGGAWTKNI
jgi:hypothetical protein